jgi:hypothetical protein
VVKRPFEKIAIFFAVLAFILAVHAIVRPAKAGQKIELWYGPGGDVHVHLARAKLWKQRGDFIIIRDMQVSADALAILEAKRLGVKMCYGKKGFNANPVLKLHQTQIANGSRWKYRDDAARYGYPSPVNGYRTVTMKQLGISACPKGIRADRKVTPGPQIWRLR